MALIGGVADPAGSRTGLSGEIAQALEDLLGTGDAGFDSEFAGAKLEAISDAICTYLESNGVGGWQFHLSFVAVGGEYTVPLGIPNADTAAGRHMVFRGGLLMLAGGLNDYTMTASAVTFSVPLVASEIVQVFARRTS